MTLQLPDLVGLNASAAADAARAGAAADAAARRAGFAPAPAGADRDDRPNAVRLDETARPVRAIGETQNAREDRVRTADYVVRRGPSPLFVAQLLGQDEAAPDYSAVRLADGVAAYPSLASEYDIFLPGEEVVYADAMPRLDIRV